MSSQVEQIKERLSIQDVVGTYVKLEKAGSNYKAKCPFHQEKTASFMVSPSRNTYYCFGCGAKGDIFSFVQEFEGLDFIGSLKVLAERAGVQLTKEDPKARSERERLYACLESATIFYQKNLYTKTENKAVVDYLLGRGLTKETIKHWRIGFAEGDWRLLMNYLKAERSFSESEIEKVGLIKRKDGSEAKADATGDQSLNGSNYYDRFRGRIMFPLFDSSGRVIGFSGRIFEGDEKSAKYLNSPETILFNKSEVLYGFHEAKTFIRELDFTILVEGQMDMLMSQQAGFKNTVAVSGTSLTAAHLERLQKLSNKVIMAFDPDSAGVKAAERSARIALSLGIEVKVAALPKGEDPALFILKHPDKWKEIVQSATHIIEFSLMHLLQKKNLPAGDTRLLATEISEQVLPFVLEIRNEIEKAHFVSLIHERSDFKEEMIWEELKKIKKNSEKSLPTNSDQPKPAGQSFFAPPAKKNAIEQKLLGILYWQESLKDPTLDTASIRQKIDAITDGRLKKILEDSEGKREDLIYEAEVSFDKSEKLQIELDELLINLEEDYRKGELTDILDRLTKAQKQKDTPKQQTLLAEFKEKSDQLAKLVKPR